MIERWKEAARRLRTEAHALYLACRDPRTPWYAKLLAAAVIAYAVSPIDLIPDFIPVLGHLDDLILVPLGIWAVLKMIPPEVMAECRARAAEAASREGRRSWLAACVIVCLWVIGVGLAGYVLFRLIG